MFNTIDRFFKTLLVQQPDNSKFNLFGFYSEKQIWSQMVILNLKMESKYNFYHNIINLDFGHVCTLQAQECCALMSLIFMRFNFITKKICILTRDCLTKRFSCILCYSYKIFDILFFNQPNRHAHIDQNHGITAFTDNTSSPKYIVQNNNCSA